MSSNEKLVFARYSNQCEEGRAKRSRADDLEFYFTKKLLAKYIDKQSKVIEIGCGTGYYGIFLHDKCKEYVGVDITPENIKLFNEKVERENISNITTIVGDGTNLNNIDKNEYDVVLIFGPMYHLPPEEREIVFEESKRICKENGIIMYAYQSKLGAYLQAGILSYPKHYPNKKSNEYILIKETDDENPGLFYFTTSKEIKESAKLHDLEIIKNIGVNFYFNKEQINSMDNEKYECWLEFSEYLCNDESCTGLSNHSILICRKK
ncbi:MAG: class I SAM-dependent methyltransferase [Treponema sp.]|jgi:ubiquinone/menaquinone biosynthesis C-methylase UbiE|nr:class I SAM-dependent methyltransferase [Treponema sp.]